MALSRDSLRLRIRRVLVERILDGTYRPGDRLVELRIAAEFDTSQGPVREALRELETMRLVETEAYRGTRVRAISVAEMRQSSHVRGLLEQEAARLAAPLLGAADRDALWGEVDALREAAATGDATAYASHNLAFHRTIVRAGGNEVLTRLWESLQLELRTLVYIATHPTDLVAFAESHAPITEALARGDGDAAGLLLREHADGKLWLSDGADPARDPADPG